MRRWTGLPSPQVRKPRSPSGDHRQREHETAEPRQQEQGLLPAGPPAQRREPHRLVGWEAALSSVPGKEIAPQLPRPGGYFAPQPLQGTFRLLSQPLKVSGMALDGDLVALLS